MKTSLRQVNDHGKVYQALMFVCPGCIDIYPGSTGLHMLAVNTTEKTPAWDFDGNANFPTLSPSIMTKHQNGSVCHSFLNQGIFEFLDDCTHSLAGQKIPIPDLPTWALEGDE